MTTPALTTPYVVVAADAAAADLALGALPSGVPAGEVTVLLAGSGADDVAAYGAAIPAGRVLVAPGLELGGPIDALGPLVAAALGDDTVVLLDASQEARDLAGWLAVAARARICWAVESIDPQPAELVVRRVVNGGDGRLVERLALGTRPLVLLTRTSTPGSGRAPVGVAPPVERLDVELAPLRRSQTEGAAASDDLASLAGARIVVSVGRGIGGPEHVPLFRELAQQLGAALGATRVVVDQGWMSFAHQVGQTGAAVAPDLYLAFGISGAVQHLVGMRDSRAIVVVNTDRHAEVCQIADVVVEADAVAVARSLLTKLENHGESTA